MLSLRDSGRQLPDDVLIWTLYLSYVVHEKKALREQQHHDQRVDP